jgi:hypothetical protein
MKYEQSILSGQPGLSRVIVCELLPPFDHTDIESVRRAFRSATPCLFQQTWQKTGNFSPGVVRAGWRGSSLMIFAELADSDIFNDATEMNQRAWELGDVFEIFLRPEDNESYVEFQITPNNLRLQLRFPDARALAWARRSRNIENFLIQTEAIQSLTWIEEQNSRWSIYAAIPSAAVCGSRQNIGNTQWHFSFGRYDYTRGASEPVISSTSLHAQPDFHRQYEWGVMTFKNSLVIQH